MTEVERLLFARLIEAFPDMLVLPQVQVCRFVEVRNVRGRTAVLNRYSRLYIRTDVVRFGYWRCAGNAGETDQRVVISAVAHPSLQASLLFVSLCVFRKPPLLLQPRALVCGVIFG